MSKVKKLMTTLMLFLTLSGTIAEPITVLANTVDTVELQENKEEAALTETVEASTESTENSSTSTEQITNTKSDQEEKIGDSQNANDSPTEEMTIETATKEEAMETKETTESSEQGTEQSVYDYLRENGYEMLEDGSIVSTTGSSYRDNFLNVIQKVESLVNPNGLKARMARATGQSIFVNRSYGSNSIGWTYSNGPSELGWYAKKDANGGMLWCVEPGVPLNWGENTPYTTSNVSQEKYIRASLAVYYGWEKQKSVVNGFYTERLVQEITTGVTTSGIFDLPHLHSHTYHLS